jgi:sugar-specific transcriptional regulator TrmB
LNDCFYSVSYRMTDPTELREIERRIQSVEENLRQLQEQATALSGAADEERIANRIADQEAKLAALLKQREDLIGNPQPTSRA